jgi:hypothetical protein
MSPEDRPGREPEGWTDTSESHPFAEAAATGTKEGKDMNIRTTKSATIGHHATTGRVRNPNEALPVLGAEREPTKRSRRPGRRALATTAGVTAGALVVLAEAGPAFAGMNLGNHNESLLLPPGGPPPAKRIRARRRRWALSAFTVAAGLAVAVGYVNDGTSNTLHRPIAGNYGTSSGGGSASR